MKKEWYEIKDVVFLYFLLNGKILCSFPGIQPLQGNTNNIFITDYRSILMIEFVFNKKPSFCFKATYISGNYGGP